MGIILISCGLGSIAIPIKSWSFIYDENVQTFNMRTPLLNFNGRKFVCQTSSSAKLWSPIRVGLLFMKTFKLLI